MLRYILSRISSRRVFPGNPVGAGRQRRGVSVLEVLFAIGVVAVGLLGVLALIPVAGAWVARGTIADAGDRLGRNAVREFHVRGMAHAGVWWEPLPAADRYGKFNPGPRQAFCIDPLFVAKHVEYGPTAGGNFGFFPSSTSSVRMRRVNLAMGMPPNSWSRRTQYKAGQFCQPTSGSQFFWYVAVNDGVSGTSQPSWPTTYGAAVSDGSVNWMAVSPAMLYDEAMSTFMSNDDLVFEFPGDSTQPPLQNYTRVDEPSDLSPVKRQNQGAVSWMVTLAPTSTGGEDIYKASVVVFHRRDLEVDYERISEVDSFVDDYYQDRRGVERLVGEVRLISADRDNLQMKQGEWVMLAGDATPARFQWYRVQMTDSEPRRHENGTDWERYVTLFGDPWPISGIPRPNVVWIPETIAVYERTVRLGI